MNSEQIIEKIKELREKVAKLEEKAFQENKSQYTILKTELDTYKDDFNFIEAAVKKETNAESLERYSNIISSQEERLNQDLVTIMEETSVLINMANEEDITAEVIEEEDVALDAPTEEVVEVAPTEVANDLDTVNTEEIINSLDSAPVAEDYTMPTQDVNLDSIDSVIDSLNLSEPTAPVEGGLIEATGDAFPAEQPMIEDTPVAEPIVEQAPTIEAPVEGGLIEATGDAFPAVEPIVEQPTMDVAPMVEPIVEQAPMADAMVQPEVAPTMEAPMAPQMPEVPVAPIMEAPTEGVKTL